MIHRPKAQLSYCCMFATNRTNGDLIRFKPKSSQGYKTNYVKPVFVYLARIHDK